MNRSKSPHPYRYWGLAGGIVPDLVAGQPVLAVVLGVAALVTSLLNASQERQASDRPPDP